MVHPVLPWVKIECAAVEEDRFLEIVDVTLASDSALDCHDLANDYCAVKSELPLRRIGFIATDSENAGDLVGNADSQTDDWAPANRIPRFTFRVVGESFENRQLDLNRLLIGEAVYLIREPHNPYDSNAVAVVNRERRVLGYLKAEVSLWFAPILDKGREFLCEVKQRTLSGGIVIAVFD